MEIKYIKTETKSLYHISVDGEIIGKVVKQDNGWFAAGNECSLGNGNTRKEAVEMLMDEIALAKEEGNTTMVFRVETEHYIMDYHGMSITGRKGIHDSSVEINVDGEPIGNLYCVQRGNGSYGYYVADESILGFISTCGTPKRAIKCFLNEYFGYCEGFKTIENFIEEYSA